RNVTGVQTCALPISELRQFFVLGTRVLPIRLWPRPDSSNLKGHADFVIGASGGETARGRTAVVRGARATLPKSNATSDPVLGYRLFQRRTRTKSLRSKQRRQAGRLIKR